MTSSQGIEYAAFIAAQVAREHDRGASFDERATKRQQGSSLTLGLFVAALGLVLEAEVEIPGSALKVFLGAVACLIAAFVAGTVATFPRAYDVTNAESLDKMVNEHWADNAVTSRNMAAHLNVRTLDRLRPANSQKAIALAVGITLQGIGMLLIAASIGVVGAFN